MKAIFCWSRKQIILSALAILLSIAVIGFIVWAVFDFPTTRRANWTLQATMVYSDGKTGDRFPLEASWRLTRYRTKGDKLSLQIPDTEELRYDVHTDGAPVFDKQGWLYTAYLCDDIETDGATPVSVMLDTDAGYMILYWQEKDCCLVASVDANVPAQEVIDHFSFRFPE